jgi:GNAT superfamily N-acetyltransferase
VIRRARRDDLDALLHVQRAAAVEAFAHVFPPESFPFPDEEVCEAWRRALADPAIDVFVAELAGVIVGSVSVGGEFLRTLYVLPSHQGTGVGSALHDHALDRLHELGAREAKLWTLEENEFARRFYERRGWRPNGETRVVEFPPNPIDVGYSLPLAERE